MNKIFSFCVLILLLLGGEKLIAQPTFIFPTEQHNAGDNFCIEVKARDFTDLLRVDFVMTWDPNVIQFTGVAGLNLKDLDPGDFDTSDAANGKLRLNWEDEDQMGVTIPPAAEETYVHFELCFKALGTFGDNTPICILEEDPIPVVTRTGTNNINIGLFQEKGLIGVEVLPIVISIDKSTGNKGDFVCVDFRVENFTKMVNLQFSVEFDSTVLEFNGINNYNVLPRFNPVTDIALRQPGAITFGWFTTSDPVTLDDSTAVFGFCFRLIGDCNSFSPIEITGNWTSIEAVTNNEPVPNSGINIGVVDDPGRITINPCGNQGGVTFTGTCPEGMPGEIVCVEISVSDFTDINVTNYLIKWNSNVLEYLSHSIEFPAYNANINSSGAALGNLRVDWRNTPPSRGLSIPDGTLLLKICFKIIGDGTLSSTVAVTGSPAVIKRVGSPDNLGINAENGCVIVNSPPGLTLSAGEYEGFQGDTICVDVLTANFNGITKMEFTIEYGTNTLTFLNVTNINTPNMSNANFTDAGNGNIVVKWETPFGFGETLADGTVAFSLCFILTGEPSDNPSVPNCSVVGFSGTSIPININTESNGDFNIGLNANNGNVCILDPGSFTLVGNHVCGDLNEIVCVEVKAVNFTLITDLQFSINWPNLSVVEFDSIEFTNTIPDFDLSNFDFSNVDVGLLSTSWADPSRDGVTLPDSTVLFRLCFKIVGAANTSSAISFAARPLNVYVASAISGSDNIGLVNIDGSVCANDYLRFIDKNVINIDCPGDSSGAVSIRLAGGISPYEYTWTGINSNSQSINNLPAGTYTVIIRDNAVPPNELRDTFTISTSGSAPIARAGRDRGMNCNNTPVKLDATGSSTGSQFSIKWTTSDTGGLVPPSDRTLQPTVTGAGTYILEIKNNSTGCAAYDTVIVAPPVHPVANAGPDGRTTCLTNEVELDGTNSQGENLRYSWKALTGDTLLGNSADASIAIATVPGIYELSIIDIQTGCTSKDTVEVVADTVPPLADAGPRMSLPCAADTIVLGGNQTSSGPEFIYEWIELDNGNIISNTDEQAVEVNATGLYQISVTDTINGCVATDTVRVIGDPNRPEADAGPNVIITCNNPVAVLDGSQSSTGTRYIYTWTGLAGGVVAPGEASNIEPTVLGQGIYQLMVTDTITGCEDFSRVSVTSNLSRPAAVIPQDTINLGCRDNIIPLEGTGSAIDSGFIFYHWTTNTGNILSGDTALFAEVQGQGSYYLEVRDIRNGCMGIDSVYLLQDTSGKPEIEIAPVTQMLTCRDSVVQLNAIGSSGGSGFITSWGPVAGIVSGTNTLTPKVNQPGIYTLSILNTANDCFASETVTVTKDTLQPIAVVADSILELPCNPPAIQLDASNSTANGHTFITAWTAVNGSSITTPASTRPTVSAEDTYMVIITDSRNGCRDTATVNVIPNTNPIEARAGADIILTCAAPSRIIAADSSIFGDNSTVFWSDTSGAILSNTPSFTVSDTGIFILQLRDTTDGCISTDTIMVSGDFDLPLVDAGPDQSFNCFIDQFTLSGNVDAGTATATYQWSSPTGNNIENPGSLNPTVFTSGEFILTAINDQNGCEASDTVSLTVSFNLSAANAQTDGDLCQDFAMLIANLPDSTTGVWTTPGTATIAADTSATTIASNLVSGVNIFFWTLSSEDCPDYSTDTVQIEIAAMPSLRNDLATLAAGQDSVLLNVLDNDNLSANAIWDFSLISEPPAGQIRVLNDGQITYSRPTGFSGELEFRYKVCSTVCPDFCDSAFVKITVERSTRQSDEVPNAITPNGDGLNDALVFDAIEIAPEKYPDRELIVFNRWGDIVFQAKPYMNDWKGTNQSGNALPEATYYYILNLDIAEGQIIRGDVTILK